MILLFLYRKCFSVAVMISDQPDIYRFSMFLLTCKFSQKDM